jgi:DNA-binding PadR family transcriptional regulator
VDEWSQLVIKETREDVELLTAAPKTGIYALDENGRAAFKRWGNDWHSLHDESEAFYLRVLGTGDYRYPGADLGLLVARSRMQTDDNQLTERARQWIEAIRQQFVGTPVDATEEAFHPHDALAFKTA